ncbi:Voltage-dependent anion channel domain containing protein [Naviculisporaceae sp. PSN 640]
MATGTDAMDHQPPPIPIPTIPMPNIVGIGGEPSEPPAQTLMMRRMSMSSAASSNINGSAYRRRPSVAAVLATNSAPPPAPLSSGTGTGTGTGTMTITSAITAAKAEASSTEEDPASVTGLGPPGPPGVVHDDGCSLRRVPTYLQPSLPWRKRLMHFTFAWYTVTMSTSGISLLLALTPHRFPGLSTIGLIIFLLDLIFFLFITAAISLRFILYKNAFRRAFTHPTEALFIPTFFLSIAAILSNAGEYALLFFPPQDISPSPMLRKAAGAAGAGNSGMAGFLKVMYWIYLGVTFLFSVGQYHLLFTVKEERRLQVSAMTPAWILPIFPVMLAGTLAGGAAKFQLLSVADRVGSPGRATSTAAKQALGIVSAGLAAQGLGMLVSVFFYATYLSRLMAFGLPVQRPGMFIAVGPPSFTAAALLSMADQAEGILKGLLTYQVDYEDGEVTPTLGPELRWLLLPENDIPVDAIAAGTRLVAMTSAVFLWGLSFWFFVSAVAAVVLPPGMPDRKFHLSWWGFIFPNVGFVLSTVRVGKVFGSEGLLWFSSVMTAGLVLAWLIIGARCLHAVRKREIMWPGHDEDSS